MFEIEYKGANGVVLSTKKATIYADPKLSIVGLKDLSTKGQIEVATEARFALNNPDAKLNIEGPGEYGVANFDIKGIAYCVGSIDLKPINLVTKKDYLKSFELNLFPVVEIIKKYKENLKKNKSSIVLFSTVAVKQGFPNHGIISPVKASLEGLTISLAAELAPHVRINCIAPSLSNSKMAGRILGNTKIAEGIAKQHPLKRVGEGMDSAALAKFLLSNESSWITGQIIGVDGGRSKLS